MVKRWDPATFASPPSVAWKRSNESHSISLLLEVGHADGAACRTMTTLGSSGADTLFGAVAATLLVVMYGQWLYRSRRLRRWQLRLRSRVVAVRELIADAERTKTAYPDSSDPSSAHERFLRRCDSSLREQFCDSFARRLSAYSDFEWIQPATLISNEQVFACYDTERRLKGSGNSSMRLCSTWHRWTNDRSSSSHGPHARRRHGGIT